MVDICCVGHITSDKVITHDSVRYMPGGTAYYFSCAICNMDIEYTLVTALADREMNYVSDLQHKGINVKVQPSIHTVYFENIYAENQDHRTQNVLQTADAFTLEKLIDVNAKIYHLGPLLADDIPVSLIKTLALKGRISLDVQGYLRKVENFKVFAVDWQAKREALQYVDILKADVTELQALTGCEGAEEGAILLADWGVKEIVVTNGSMGSLIYNDGVFYTIAAYQPKIVADATGCGDTFMAGYLYQRLKGAGPQVAGEFAAAMAGLKTQIPGAFNGTEADVSRFLEGFIA